MSANACEVVDARHTPGMTDRAETDGFAAKFRQLERRVNRHLRAKSAACVLTVNTRQLPQE
jgi:hypothetical protein